MAAESRDAGAVVVTPDESAKTLPQFVHLRRLLDEEPFRVQFFQAVRLMQRMDAEREPVGYFITPQNETVRFAARTSLAFPPSEIHQIKRGEQGQPRMVVEFMGVCAAITIMPHVYTEFLLDRIKQKDHAMEEFLNIFNHRMISLFYRGWEKYRFFIEYERTREDHFSDRMLDFLGLGTSAMRNRSRIPDVAYLNYVGLLARHVRSAATLEQVLEDFFEVPVRVQQFAGTWRKLAPENQTCFLGLGGANERLGMGVVAGDEVWDQHGRFAVLIGPMRLDQYLRFLPGQEAYLELVSWIRFYTNGFYEAEVRLIMAREDAPPCVLGSKESTQPRLGMVSWLRTRPLDHDPGDASYLIQ